MRIGILGSGLMGGKLGAIAAVLGQEPDAANFQPATQPTICDVLCDLQVFWQSPRCSKLL